MHLHSRPAFRVLVVALVVGILLSGTAFAQGRPKSPRTNSSTQIGDAWIDVTYSAPILRGRRDVFGSGDSYGQAIYAGAPVWRAGADVTTRIKTGLDLEIDGRVQLLRRAQRGSMDGHLLESGIHGAARPRQDV